MNGYKRNAEDLKHVISYANLDEKNLTKISQVSSIYINFYRISKILKNNFRHFISMNITIYFHQHHHPQFNF